ncbi:MAG: hypothetical protein NT126_10220 [Bacteroidetes bacterium]|nr:hypothetical protein [Bacteroidota bacterium]
MKPDLLSDDELEKLAPELSKIKKENPFRVPENYFDSLAGEIQHKISELPDLERMNKKNPFAVPEGYFDSLPSLVQQRIIDAKNKKSIFGEWISISLRPKYALAVVMVIILCIAGIRYLSKPVKVESPDNYLSCDDIQNSSYLATMDESTLVEALELQSGSTEVNENAGMEQYLIDNDIDISQLENHL